MMRIAPEGRWFIVGASLFAIWGQISSSAAAAVTTGAMSNATKSMFRVSAEGPFGTSGDFRTEIVRESE